MDQTVLLEKEGRYETKIVLAEDEVLLRMVLADALRREGFQIIEAVDAGDAIKALNFNPDVALVVYDMRMRSAEDGMVIARHVRAHHSGVKLVLAAGQAPSSNDDLFDVFFPKPYELDRIVGWIKRHIKSRQVMP
jgi:two-component system, cell cycle response regulator CpdR